MAKNHVPIRTCIGCGTKRAKAELWRFVYDPASETIAFDPRKRLSGRGCYLCPDLACLQQACKRRGIDRAYRRKVPARCYQVLTEIFKSLQDNARENL